MYHQEYSRIHIQKNETVSKIAFFDFDGTITYKDTLLEFIKFAKGDIAFWSGFLLYSPFIVSYKLGIISNQVAKEKILRHFFSNTSSEEFDSLCREFSEKKIPGLIREKAIREIYKLKEEGAEVVIVSASAENWVAKWSNAHGLSCIATRMECNNNFISGRISGKNCYGEEKVDRIKKEFDLSRYNKIYCYGDTEGDRPMLELGDVQFFKPFR